MVCKGLRQLSPDVDSNVKVPRLDTEGDSASVHMLNPRPLMYLVHVRSHMAKDAKLVHLQKRWANPLNECQGTSCTTVNLP